MRSCRGLRELRYAWKVLRVTRRVHLMATPSPLPFSSETASPSYVQSLKLRSGVSGGLGLLWAALAFCMLTLVHAGRGLSLTGSSWGTGAEGPSIPDCHRTPSIPLPCCALHCAQHFPASLAAGFGPGFLPVGARMEGGKWKGRRSQDASLSFPPPSILGVFWGCISSDSISCHGPALPASPGFWVLVTPLSSLSPWWNR